MIRAAFIVLALLLIGNGVTRGAAAVWTGEITFNGDKQ